MGRLLVIVVVAVGATSAACKRGRGALDDHKPAAGADVPAQAAAGSTDAAERRAAWIATVRGLVAAPATIPRLADPASRRAYEALVSESAWLELDAEALSAGGGDALTFFPVAKALSLALSQLGAVDEVVLLGLYMNQVEDAFIAAGLAMLRDLPADDPTRGNREHGLETMRVGAAMNVGGVLFSLPGASAPIFERAIASLTDERGHGLHSATSLQLVLATIDDGVLPVTPMARMPQVLAVRTVIARRHAALAAASPPSGVVYEGLTTWATLEPRTVASRAGGFAVTVGPGALVWTTTTPGAAASTVLYQLQWRSGDAIFDVTCSDGMSAPALAERFTSMGAVERTGPGPGTWLAHSLNRRPGTIRIVTIGSRTCLAGFEAPPGQFTPAQLDATLASLRARP